MSRAREIHRLAMDKLHSAEQALERGESGVYISLLTQALEYETEAAFLLRDKINAEPTRSVLFRSAATLAVRCENYKQAERLIFTALAGDPPAGIRSELLNVLSQTDGLRPSDEKNTPLKSGVTRIMQRNDYITSLRERAIAIKVEPKDQKHLSVVRADYAIDVLHYIRSSYFSFTEADFNRTFAEEEFYVSKERILNRLKSDDLLIPDLQYASFGISLSVDAFTLDGIPTKIAKWRAESFERFKKNVIYLNYNSMSDISDAISIFDDDEIRSIYSPIVSLLKESNGYIIKVMDKGYAKAERVLTPIAKAVAQAIIPKKAPRQEDEVKLFQALGVMKEGESVLRKDNIINITEIEYMEFNNESDKIQHGKEYLILKEPYLVKIVYERGIFNINVPELNISVATSSHKDIVPMFNNEVVKLYKRLFSVDKHQLSIDDVALRDKLDDLVSMSAVDK